MAQRHSGLRLLYFCISIKSLRRRRFIARHAGRRSPVAGRRSPAGQGRLNNGIVLDCVQIDDVERRAADETVVR